MKSSRKLLHISLYILIFCILIGQNENLYCNDNENKYGLAISQGYSYNAAEELGFTMVHGVLDYPYDKIWNNGAPEQLRFRIEPALGRTFYGPDGRTMGSLCVFAHYYLDRFSIPGVRPFVQGGIGGIYTDFQLEEQGSRLNFNPQLGIGADLDPGWGRVFFGTLRLHHISNANIVEHNRGINSLVFQFGSYF